MPCSRVERGGRCGTLPKLSGRRGPRNACPGTRAHAGSALPVPPRPPAWLSCSVFGPSADPAAPAETRAPLQLMHRTSVLHRLVPLLAALVLAACEQKPTQPAGVISRERFVAANVAVRALPDTAQPAARAAALKKAGVTERQLRMWVAAHARNAETLSKTWEEIAFKVDSIGGAMPAPVAGEVPPGSPPAVATAPRPVPDARRDSLPGVAPNRDSLLAIPRDAPMSREDREKSRQRMRELRSRRTPQRPQ